MKTKESITKLKLLQAELDALREKLEISAPNAVIYLADLDCCSDEQVVVEADGFGGATTSIVEGNYPIDYITSNTKKFESEDGAVRAAEKIIKQHAEPKAVLN